MYGRGGDFAYLISWDTQRTKVCFNLNISMFMVANWRTIRPGTALKTGRQGYYTYTQNMTIGVVVCLLIV